MDDRKQLEEAAIRAHRAFCESAAAAGVMPKFFVVDWSKVPDLLKTAWKAAAKAIDPSLR